ncbi:hypothetical protein ACLESD_21505 [Pyxidicoccus sp. 3LFB2]
MALPHSSPLRGRLASFVALALALAGCAGPPTTTIVTGMVEPKQIRFVTVVKPDAHGVGGWQAACIHVRITRSGTEESFLCRFGIEMPVRNSEGPVSVSLAQRVAADRINETAHLVLGSATPATPLGMLCETFKSVLAPRVAASIAGAMMAYRCHKATLPVEFGEFVL